MIGALRAGSSSPPARQALRLIGDSRGGTAIEYALVAAMIAMVIVGALGELGAALIALPLPALVTAFENALN
jgi:Flp pilus assembly pilin Flp